MSKTARARYTLEFKQHAASAPVMFSKSAAEFLAVAYDLDF